MKWEFRLRGRPVALTRLDGVAAVAPTRVQVQRARSRAKIAELFGREAIDTARGGRFGLDLGSRNRLIFERAGWLFVEPRSAVARAARMTRATVASAATVQQVFIDRSGNVLVGTDVLTVQVDAQLSRARAERLLQGDSLRIVRRLPFAPNAYEVVAADRRPLPDFVDFLQGRSHYQFAEPMLLQAITGRLRPTDPEFREQWQHSNDGSYGGTPGAAIGTEQAWDVTRGRATSRAVRIAVIDNGMQVDHPDLRAGLVGGGHFESNRRGSTTFVRLKKRSTADFPDYNHGTFCMGMAGARMGNRRGGCGAAPEADLIAIACLEEQVGSQATLARALAYAADPSTEDAEQARSDGADVIACSLGPNGADWNLTSVLDLAIKFAARKGRGGKGVPIFWAVSNGFVEIERDEVCSHRDVIAVGASDRTDRAAGTAYGPKLEFLAPGVDVFSTRSGSRYGFDTGCSFAAPLAAGVAALVLARHPRWTAKQVLRRLRSTCDRVGGVRYGSRKRHREYGHGRINAARAVR